MSSSVDNRIVQMTFDNKQFESGVQTSLNTLEKLNDALSFSDQSGISNLASSLESLNNKFSTLGIIGANVVSRLTQEFMNSLLPIINSVASTVGSLTVNFETLSQSFGKYEQMVTNQQTIMSAVSEKINELTGEKYNMEDVAEIINRLRWYTDETSYNLDQMVNAVGNFTSSGLDLAESEDVIIGIANACADAGISAEKADIAMTGFSKALGAGKLSTGIWSQQLKTSGITNSERFKQALLDAAEAEGTLIRVNGKLMDQNKKEVIDLSNMAETFSKYDWATENVLKKVLMDYAKTVRGVYDLTDEGKIDITSEAFADLTKAMKEQDETLESLGLDQSYDQASDAIKALTNAYIKLGLEVPKSLKAFTRAQEAVSWSQSVEATAVAVRSQWARTFELIFGNYEEAKQLWSGVANSMWGIFAGGGDSRNEIFELWHDNSYERFSEGFVKAFENIETIVDSLRNRFNSLFATENLTFVENIANKISKATDSFANIMDLVGSFDLFEYAKTWKDLSLDLGKGKLRPLVADMENLAELDLDKPWAQVKQLVNAFGSLEKVLKGFTILDNIRKTFNGFVSVLDLGRQAISGFWRATEPLRDLLFNIGEKVLGVSGSFGEWITNLSESTKESDFFYNVFKKLVDIIMNVGVPTFETLSNIFKKIKDFLSPLGQLLSNTKDALKEFFGSISEKNTERIQKVSDIFSTIGTILGTVFDKILAAAKRIAATFKEIFGEFSLKDIGDLINTFLKAGILSKISSFLKHFSYDLNTTTESISDSFYILKGNLSYFFDTSRIKVGNTLLFAASILILATAFSKLSKIDGAGLANASLGMGVLFAELAVAMRILTGGDVNKPQKKIRGLITLSLSMLILAKALRDIGGLQWSEILRGVTGLGIVMLELVLASKYMNRIKANPVALLGLSSAMLIFALDLKIIGSMKWDEIIRGVAGIGIILAELAVFFATMKTFGGGAVSLIATATAIAVISASMLVFAGVLKVLATIDQESLGNGLVAIGVGLLEFAIAANLMKGTLPAAAAILTISAAIAVLTASLVVMKLITWDDIAKGLIVFAGALGVMVVAGKLLAGTELTLLAFAASVTLVGIGIAAIGAGILALSVALSAGATLIVESIVLIVTSLIDLIPTIIEKIAEGIIAVIELIGNSATAIIEAVVQIGMALLIAIDELVPKIIETGINLILSLLKGIADNIYQITILAGQIVVEFINGIAVMLPEIVDSGINLVISFIEGMARAIVEHTDELLSAVGQLTNAVVYFLATILDNLLKDMPIFGDKIHGELTKIKDNIEQTLSKSEGEKIGSNITSGIKSGIEKNESSAIKAAGSMATKALKAAKDMLGIQSPSKAFAEVGKYADEGLAQGLYSFTSRVTDASASVAESALETIQNPMKTIGDLVSDEVDLDPVITPVLDLSKIQNGARNISSMFGTTSIAGVGSIGQFSNGTVNDTTAGYSPTVNVTIYASEGQSSDDLYNTFTRRLNNDVRRRSLVWDH